MAKATAHAAKSSRRAFASRVPQPWTLASHRQLLIARLGVGQSRSYLTAAQAPAFSPHVPVTSDDVQAYQRDGVVQLRGAFGPDWVAYMRQAFDEAMDRPGKYAEFIGEGVTRTNLFSEGADRRKVEMFQDQVFYEEALERVPAWAAVAETSPAAAIIARLMESDTVSFFYMHPILKRGGAQQAIPWHQDLPYWKVDGRQIGSVWIALDDMPLSASVQYLSGSHAWGLFRPRHFVDHTPYEGRDEPALPDIESMLREGRTRALAFEVKAGDALCFDARVVHGSLGNPEAPGRDHRRVALRFGGDDATYCDRPGETAIPTPEIDASHGLRHGDRLVCKAFPRVWPRQ
ncbi:unnamed protein product [Polarella glacialis]|uniref:Phytanoyl-CoA dioxygenase n=1 Tax=Polarella glacialis TaxID=89957 RepID=A0A813J7J5_POLGL|nr:unnamed protein product [Polarella glacialis]CAE8671573.1 unnamed protein product [Polarella glacialis]